jgi:putative transposase
VARLGRYFLPDQPLHVIQRGNNRAAISFRDDDHARYRDWLAALRRPIAAPSTPLSS